MPGAPVTSCGTVAGAPNVSEAVREMFATTLEIEAELLNGISESTVRTVMENCRTLRFESQGFEEE